MKSVKISLVKGCGAWVFHFYDSSESAFCIKGSPTLYGDEFTKRITLKRGEDLEVEWLGSEWVHGDGSSERFDKIKVRKFSPIDDSPMWDVCVDTTTGWMIGGSLDWNGCISHEVRIIPLTMGDEYSLDNSRLFIAGVDPDGADDVSMVGDPN